MVQITFENEQAVLKFPKQLMTSNYVQQFIARMKVETIISEKANSSETQLENQVWELSEEIKNNWWRENEAKLLQGIKLSTTDLRIKRMRW